MGNWFGGNETQIFLVVGYLILSVLGTAYFVVKEFQSVEIMQAT